MKISDIVKTLLEASYYMSDCEVLILSHSQKRGKEVFKPLEEIKITQVSYTQQDEVHEAVEILLQ